MEPEALTSSGGVGGFWPLGDFSSNAAGSWFSDHMTLMSSEHSEYAQPDCSVVGGGVTWNRDLQTKDSDKLWMAMPKTSAPSSTAQSQQQHDFETSQARTPSNPPPRLARAMSSGTTSHYPSHLNLDKLIEVEHQSSTTRTFYCKVCPASSPRTRFRRRADAFRHVVTIHFPQQSRFDCEVKRCRRKGDRGFTRLDHYRQHVRETHGLKVQKPLEKEMGSESLKELGT